MSDYKLVPVEPTPEMIDAAAEAYMPFGDMALALQMGIVAAPAVQGEPVAYAAFAENGNIQIWCSDPNQAETLRHQYGDRIKPLYAAPHPAEQQPDATQLVEALESIMGYIPLDVVQCRGDKCRELWCASCFGDEEAESYLVTTARHLKNAKSALAAYRKGARNENDQQ